MGRAGDCAPPNHRADAPAGHRHDYQQLSRRPAPQPNAGVNRGCDRRSGSPSQHAEPRGQQPCPAPDFRGEARAVVRGGLGEAVIQPHRGKTAARSVQLSCLIVRASPPAFLSLSHKTRPTWVSSSTPPKPAGADSGAATAHAAVYGWPGRRPPCCGVAGPTVGAHLSEAGLA